MHTFSYGCDFMVGLGKPKLNTKFEVASFIHCVIIEGEPQNLGSFGERYLVVPFNIYQRLKLATSDLPSSIIQSHTEEKVDVVLV